MLEGLMQDDFPLTLQHVLGRMRGLNAAAEVVTLTDGRASSARRYAEVARARRPARARARARSASSRATASRRSRWNNQRHLELYFAVPCMGAVLHTLNIRLFAEQLTYIVNHAEDRVIFVDDSLVPVLEKLAPTFETVEHYVVMGDGDAGSLPNVLRYEELLADAGGRASTTPSSTSARPPASATRAARPATRRASSTRTARSVLHSLGDAAWPTRSGSRAPTACCRSCRCSTPTPGASRTRAALVGRRPGACPAASSQAEPLARADRGRAGRR